jgi:hypothetical protein
VGSTQLTGGDVAEAAAKLEQQPGENMLVSTVVLGDGKSLFRTAAERISLTLLEAKPFRSGNVLICYQPSAR